jgi:hypothetical protein
VDQTASALNEPEMASHFFFIERSIPYDAKGRKSIAGKKLDWISHDRGSGS